jgi:probable F420-dependent oxidoreductase
MSTLTSARQWRESARRCEDLGFDTLMVPDHLVLGALAPLPALVAAAASTSTLKVATQLLCNEFRHPAVVAREAATVDLLSDGRLELGIGAGWSTEDFWAVGMPYAKPRVRIDRLAEAVSVIRGLWSEGPFAFTGDHYTINDLDGSPKPRQRPGPPIAIGGGGRLLLGVAGRAADIIGVHFQIRPADADGLNLADASPARTDERIGWIREAAGDRYSDIELNVVAQHAQVTNDAAGSAAAAAVRFGTTPGELLATPAVLIGSVDAICDRLAELRERWDLSYIKIAESAMADFAPVVARCAGT